MPTATVSFHGSLNDFLPASRRGAAIAYRFEGEPSIKDAIEALGVPHPEVDLILAGGRSVDFGHRLGPGDRIEVFGLDRPIEAGRPTGAGLIPVASSPPRFVLDGHLGRLARYLRMLGFDARYDNRATDDELARLSADERRILLTRDRGLLKRSIVLLGYLVRGDDPRRQLDEVAGRYGLAPLAAPFSRCVRCNGLLEQVDRLAVAERLANEPRTLRYFDSFGRCLDCGSIYWQGSHFERMSRLVRQVVHEGRAIGDNRPEVDARTEG
ncbi:MAG: Mut7-C RNAse domain-containing protein [Candidatus Limnocylindrales bacterium]